MARLSLPLVLASLVVALAAGCSQQAEEEEPEETGASTESALTELRFQTLRATLPITKDEHEVFASEKELRAYFGTSCGLLCTTPWSGDLPFTIGEGEYVVLISRAKSAPRQGFRIGRASKAGNPKWLRVQTCATNSGVPYALVKVKPDFLTIWVGDDGPLNGC